MYESIKALESNTSMLMLLPLFLNCWLIHFNCCSYCTNFNTTAERTIPIGTPTKEAKMEVETHPVTAKAKIRISNL